MLELAFDHRLIDPASAHLERMRLEGALTAASEAKSQGSRNEIAALFAAIGTRPGPMDESYFAEALAFHLAQTHAHLRSPDDVADCIAQSRTLPADGGDLLFPDHVARSLRLFEHREAARARGMPTFIIASMPRASSTSLTQTLARNLDMPVLRVSLGRFPHYILAPSWLNSVTPGGAVLHDHFGATPENLATLRRGGAQEVFVLVRDPRAAAASFVNFVLGPPVGGRAGDDRWAANVLAAVRNLYVPWLGGWITAGRGDLRVRWIESRRVKADLSGVWRELLLAHAALYPVLAPALEIPLTEVKTNLVDGDDDRWREWVSADIRQAMWEALSPAMVELLDLKL